MKSDQLKIHYHSFLYNLKIGCSKKNRENYLKKFLNKRIKEPRLKFDPELALIGL